MQWMSTMLSLWTKPANHTQHSSVCGANSTALDCHKDTTEAGDAYRWRYDKLIKDIPRKVQCVDDAVLWDYDIENNFYHIWDYLTLCANNSIVINKEKLQFCRNEILFAGLKITKTSIAPSDCNPRLLNIKKHYRCQIMVCTH